MSLFKSVATFGGFTLVSRITGFVRDMLLAGFLGAGAVADAFFVAFKLPNLFRSLFAEGAFTSAFVPLLSQKMVAEGEDSAFDFASKAISVLVFFLLLFVLVVEIFMPQLVALMAPGFLSDPDKFHLTVDLSRITFPFLLFVSVVSFQSGILNALNRFAAPAAAPVILNLMMAGAVFVYFPFINTPAYNISVSVTVAGLIEIIWLGWFLKKAGAVVRMHFNILALCRSAEIKTLFRRIAPGILGAGIYQINMMVDTIIVSLVGTGAISWLYYANRLQQLPLGVIGAAISVALLPILSKHIKAENLAEARRVQDNAVEYGALFAIPAAFALIVLAVPVINILFQHGKFGTLETTMTARAVIAYSVGLPVYVLVKALTPNFFARGDTQTPVKYSIVVFAANIGFSLLLMKPFGHVGVASATTIAAFVSCGQYVYGLKKRGYWTFSGRLKRRILMITLSSLIMAAAIYLGETALNARYGNWLHLAFMKKIALLSGLCILGVATFGIMAKLTGAVDYNEILKVFAKKGKKNV